MTSAEIVDSLELLKAEIEWDHDIGYQVTLEEAINKLKKPNFKKPIGVEFAKFIDVIKQSFLKFKGEKTELIEHEFTLMVKDMNGHIQQFKLTEEQLDQLYYEIQLYYEPTRKVDRWK